MQDSKTDKPERVRAADWLQPYFEKLDAGKLGLDGEELKRIDAERAADLAYQADQLRNQRLDRLAQRLPEHYSWACKFTAPDWTAIRRVLRRAVNSQPGRWILLGTPVGNAKTTALVAEGIRAIAAGRSVRYVAGADWTRAIKSNQLAELLRCDLLLVDELHWLIKQPAWITAEAMGVLDRRYQNRRRLQVYGAGSLPVAELVKGLPPGLADRFDIHLGADENSQRRKP
jgi:hypothetical protein